MKIFLLILKVTLILAVLAWAIIKFDPAVAKELLQSANINFAFLSILTTFFAYYLISLRWKMILRGIFPENNLPIFKLYFFNILAVFYTIFIPTTVAAEAVRVMKLANETSSKYSKSFVTIVIDRLVGLFLWLMIFVISPSPLKSKKIYLFLFLLVPVFYFLRNKIVIWGHKLFDFSTHHPADIIKGVLYSLAGQFFFILAGYFAFKCFDINLTIGASINIMATATMANIIPLSLLGIGMREASMLGLLQLYGVTSTASFFAMTFMVFLTYLFGLSGGMIELAKSGWHFSRLKVETKDIKYDEET